jgi:limonene-1,2-epoxide hydrolase
MSEWNVLLLLGTPCRFLEKSGFSRVEGTKKTRNFLKPYQNQSNVKKRTFE